MHDLGGWLDVNVWPMSRCLFSTNPLLSAMALLVRLLLFLFVRFPPDFRHAVSAFANLASHLFGRLPYEYCCHSHLIYLLSLLLLQLNYTLPPRPSDRLPVLD